jgi:uncharacterized protein
MGDRLAGPGRVESNPDGAKAPISSPDDLARTLAEPSSWPDESQPIEVLQTHISHVFLTGDRVFKLRKAVALPFLDFSTLDARNDDCLREVALNRRLAPSVYLGVAPIVIDGSSVRVGPIGQTLSDRSLEHVVVMRRLPEGRDALSLIDANEFGPGHVESIALLLKDFHDSHGLGRPAPWSSQDWRDRIAEPVLESLAAIVESELVPIARTQAIEKRIRSRLEVLRPEFESRRIEGRAVDAHGDLHLDHAWFEADTSAPLLIDCIEFNDDLRRIDRASEAAFLAMDLRYRGRADLAEWFLAAYAGQTDDFGLFAVVDFFAAYRALVRAKVAALAASQSSIDEGQRRKARASVEAHVALTEALIDRPSTGEMILLCGTVGSGKSTVARQLAQSGHGIPIASDRVRKVLAGLESAAHASSLPDEGIYRPEQVEEVYRALLDRAVPVVASGRTAILDASFTKRAQRDAAREWAAQNELPVRLIEVRCRKAIAIDRLRERTRRGTDPSDAGPEFLETSLARFEPPDEWPSADHQIIHSDDEAWQDQIS